MSDLGSTRVLGDLIVTGDILCDSLADQDHSHADATTSASGFMSAADKTKLNGLSNYSHPTGDGNLHMPATGTGSAGKYLKAGTTAGSTSWQSVAWGDITSKPSTFTPAEHTHDYLALAGGTMTGDLNLVNSYPCVKMEQNGLKTRLITDNSHFWIEGTAINASTPTSRLKFNLTNGELYIGNANSRVYHEAFKPTPADIGAATADHTHASSGNGESIISKDTRDTNVLPKDRGPSLTADFKRNTVSELDDGGTYHGILHFRPYGSGTDFSGGPAHQLGFTQNGSMWMRTSTGSEAWGNWKKLLTHTDNIIVNTAQPTINLMPSTNVEGAGAQVIFGSTDNQHVRIRANHYDNIKAPYGLHIEKCEPNAQAHKAYLMIEGDLSTGGKAYLAANTNPISTTPTISLAIGDSDTGINWHSDGNMSLYANNQQVLNWTNTSITAIKRFTPNGGINRFSSYSQSVGSDYFNTSIELRETNEVGSGQSTPDYAPSLGFHWGNRAAATIAMHSDGHFYFRAQGFTSNQYRNIYCNELRAVRAYNAVWNDYAEFFEKENLDEDFEPGDVVVWSKNGVIKSQSENSSKVVGVFSDTYGHIVGGEDGVANIEDNYVKFVPIGLSGRVNVKLIGNIKVGDLITTSNIEGVAQKAINPMLGTIIGKALEDKEDDDIKRISMLILNT